MMLMHGSTMRKFPFKDALRMFDVALQCRMLPSGQPFWEVLASLINCFYPSPSAPKPQHQKSAQGR